MKKAKNKFPVTPAIRALEAAGACYEEGTYDYVHRIGTSLIADSFGVDEHLVVKTLIMETDNKKPMVVLMHGDRSVSTKNMARILGVKSVHPCEPSQAERNSGYKCGGTSPFGTRKKMPIYVEKTILELTKIYINGGHQGFVLTMKPDVLVNVLHPIPVEVAIDPLD
ncbi:MAG: YbaK/EbsC family protein [Lentisphaeria bacterium]